MAGRFLSLFKPIGRILPEIKKPERKVSFNEKLFWTALVLVVFLVMTEIPLYGVSAGAQDKFRVTSCHLCFKPRNINGTRYWSNRHRRFNSTVTRRFKHH